MTRCAAITTITVISSVIVFIVKFVARSGDPYDLIVLDPVQYQHHQSKNSHTANQRCSTIQCDRHQMSCYFGQLWKHSNDTLFLYVPNLTLSERSALSALLINPGIGSPAGQYYLDDWSFMQDLSDSDMETDLASHWETILLARRALRLEIESHPNGRFTPIYLATCDRIPSKSLQYQKIDGLSILLNPLWPQNYFRLVYAAAAAIYSIEKYGFRLENLKSNLFLLDDHIWAPSFFDLGLSGILGFMTTDPERFYIWSETLGKDCIFSQVVIGISRDAIIEENTRTIDISFKREKRSSFIKVANHLAKSKLNSKCDSILVLERKGTLRKIINLHALVHELSLLTDSKVLKVVMEDYPLSQQIKLASSSKVLIGAHGAGLTNMIFMPAGSLIVELFPFGFEKQIYRNLAETLGHRYISWVAPRVTNSRSTHEGCSKNMERNVDWASQVSKDFWRNQFITVDIADFVGHLKPQFDLEQYFKEQYLIYMPWEQFNNQLIAFKSACAIAHFTNRTLVIPPFGYRKSSIDESTIQWHGNGLRVYDPLHYEWQPITRYFDHEALKRLPCKTIPLETFRCLNGKKPLRTILLRNLGFSKGITRRQIEQYYFWIAGIDYNDIKPLSSSYLIFLKNPREVDKLFSRFSQEPVLAIGVAFWLYTFGKTLDYPLTRFHDMMDDPTYRSITSGVAFHPDLRELGKKLMAHFKCTMTIHWRRGDYRKKCLHGNSREMTELMMKSCYQTIGSLYRYIRRKRVSPFGKIQIFIATNEGEKVDIFNQIQRHSPHKIISLQMLIRRGKISCYRNQCRKSWCLSLYHLNELDLAILDKIICINSQWFIGNYYSSFSRTISDQRDLRGAKSTFF